jgi:hypothetical protein
MNKVVLSVLGLTLIAGCSGYDYYKTNIRYRQEGKDCVYYYTEKGQKYNNEISSLKDSKKIVYQNTKCESLYADDTFGFERNDRKGIVPVFNEEKSAPKCGCAVCGKKQTLKNRYVVVPSAS